MSDESLKSARFELSRIVRFEMEQTQRWEIRHWRCEFGSVRWDIGNVILKCEIEYGRSNIGDAKSNIGHRRCEFEM